LNKIYVIDTKLKLDLLPLIGGHTLQKNSNNSSNFFLTSSPPTQGPVRSHKIDRTWWLP